MDAQKEMMSSGTFPDCIPDVAMMRVCRFLELGMGLYDSRFVEELRKYQLFDRGCLF